MDVVNEQDLPKIRATGLARSSARGIAAIERLPLKLLDWLAIILFLITAAFLFLAFVVGPMGSASSEGIALRGVEHSVVFAGSDFNVRMKVDGATLPICSAGVSNNGSAVALVIDRSPSMSEGGGSRTPLDEAKAAAQDFVDNLSLGAAGDSVAAVQFDGGAQLLYPLGTDSNAAKQAIGGIQLGNSTAIDQGLRVAREALASTPSGKQPVIVLLTDGQSDPLSAVSEATQAKSAGIRIITVGLGSGADQDLLRRIASSSQDAYVTPDPSALQGIYQQIGAQLGPVVATNVRVQEIYDNQHFTLSGPGNTNPGQFNNQYPTLTTGGRVISYRLKAPNIGSWSVSPQPGSLSYLNCQGQNQSQALPAGPQILVLPPLWLFLLPFLLALLWLLFRLAYWFWKRFLWEPGLQPRGPRITPPRAVAPPLQWTGPSTGWQPEPALVLGLGGTGRWVLTHLKRNLLDAGGGAWRSQVRLLSLDTSDKEYAGNSTRDVSFAGTELSEAERLVLTGENLDDIITEMTNAPSSYPELRDWFPASDYATRLGAGDRDLARGTSGRRPIGRVAVFRDLAKGLSGSDLWTKLKGAVADIRAAAKERNITYERIHIFVVASIAGGFGSGSVIDVAYLARRACEALELKFSDAEVSLFLVTNEPFDSQVLNLAGTPLTQINTRAALREVERFLLSRNRPFPINYKNEAELKSDDDQKVLQSSALNIIDDCWLLDGHRTKYNLASPDVPPELGIFPMMADAISVLLDTAAQTGGMSLGASRLASSGRAHSLQLDLGQAVFSAFGTFTYRLPMRNLVAFLRVRLARELLSLLLTGNKDSNLAHQLDIQANGEAAGTTPREYAGNFMEGKTGSGDAPLALRLAYAVYHQEQLRPLADKIADVGLRSRKEGDSLYLDLETQDFSRYLRDAVWRLLNGNSDNILLARTGKLAYTQAFLRELDTIFSSVADTHGWQAGSRAPRWSPLAGRILPEVMQRYTAAVRSLREQLDKQEQMLRITALGEDRFGKSATCVVDALIAQVEKAEKELASLYTTKEVRQYLLSDQNPATVKRRLELLNHWYDQFFAPNLSEALQFIAWNLPDEESDVAIAVRLGSERGVALRADTIAEFSGALMSVAEHAGQQIWQRTGAVNLLIETMGPIASNVAAVKEISERSIPALEFITGGLGQHAQPARYLYTLRADNVPQWVNIRNTLLTQLQAQDVVGIQPLDSTDLYTCTSVFLWDLVPMSVISRVANVESAYMRYYGMVPAIGIGMRQQGVLNPEPSSVFPPERRAEDIFERRMLRMPEARAWLLSALFVGALEKVGLVEAQPGTTDLAGLFLEAYAADLVATQPDQQAQGQICVLKLGATTLQLSAPVSSASHVPAEVIGMQNFVLGSKDQHLTTQADWTRRGECLKQELDKLGKNTLENLWTNFNTHHLNRTQEHANPGLADLVVCSRIWTLVKMQAL